ncbi:response regulator transcription factor [Deinococcus misasensis]|uniref:response regulator transcription factor n=1 Tax=Deinococcus misasensis TaxID=392413 RepID=UPI000A814FFC|nr:response regulator transcription factor [Deinococcus misasensis]
MKDITVLIIEDHLMVRAGMVYLVQQACPEAQVLQAGSLQEARLLVREADHVLLDLSLPDGNGLEVLSEFSAQACVTVLTALDSPAFQKRALDLGAQYFLSKNAPPEDLQGALLGLLEPQVNTRKVDKMSPREQEVFHLMGVGLSTGQICERLSIDEKTLYTHRRHIQQKLGLRDSQQLLHHAVVYQLSPKGSEKP